MQTFWSEMVENAREITARALDDIRSREHWEKIRAPRREEFFEMVGLGVRPQKCDLAVHSFGTLKGPGYRIEKLSFESLPDVRVTGTLYVPDGLKGRAPAVLYPCGHAVTGTEWYQPHGDIWARRGYVCFIFNTVEQSDSAAAGGTHHGLCLGRRNDWISLGYAASGGELWNSIRALDLLLSRPEVDPARVGVTGNSGGGALSYWIPIADERVKAAAPFCGLSTIGSHVADRTINGHCDCMLYHNIFARDLVDVGALIAPRPLLIGSATHDPLFHPDGFREIARRLKKIYALYGAEEQVALCEYPGPHGYSVPGHTAVQKWFDKYVAGDERPIYQPEPPRFSASDLTFYNGAPPAGDRIAQLPEILSVRGRIPLVNTREELAAVRAKVLAELRRTTFRQFPSQTPALALTEVGDWIGDGAGVKIVDFTTEGQTRLRLWLWTAWEKEQRDILLAPMAPGDCAETLCRKVREFHTGPLAVVEARGTGTLSWDKSQDIMLTRAALLTGRTPDSVRVWDILRGLEALRAVAGAKAGKIWLYGRGANGVLVLHAALFDESVAGVLSDTPTDTHLLGPYLLGVLRVLDVPQVAGLLAPRPLALVEAQQRQFNWTTDQYARLGCRKALVYERTMQLAMKEIFGTTAS